MFHVFHTPPVRTKIGKPEEKGKEAKIWRELKIGVPNSVILALFKVTILLKHNTYTRLHTPENITDSCRMLYKAHLQK